MQVYTARSARVRAARKLLQAKHRAVNQQFLAEGPQAVREAISAGVACEVFVTEEAMDRRAPEVGTAVALGLPVLVVEEAALASLADARTPQGLIATCTWIQPSLDDAVRPFRSGRSGQAVLAHEMADPGNAGALIRVADAVGAWFVAFSDGSVDPTNPKVVRASVGSLLHLPVVAAGRTADAVARLRAAGIRVLAADVATRAVDLFEAERAHLLDGPVAWLFGNEAHGLPDDLLAEADQVVRIPILGRAESLNVATAAAVCLYAYARSARTHAG
ncbi:MAG: RNA methyltransferase [Candidatus Nanopelagicales bacterium]